MLKSKGVFSSFSTNNLAETKEFYSEILGLEVDETDMGLSMRLPGGGMVFVYPKGDHKPASFTVLNFDVDDVDEAVDELKDAGVRFERHDAMTGTDEITRGGPDGEGPDIAWFKDPAGNILSVLESDM